MTVLAGHHGDEPYRRIPFPPKWRVRLLTIYCLRRWDLRLLLRDYLSFRCLVISGANPNHLLHNWHLYGESYWNRRPSHWRFVYLDFGLIQMLGACTASYKNVMLALYVFSSVVYGFARLVRGAVRVATWLTKSVTQVLRRSHSGRKEGGGQ